MSCPGSLHLHALVMSTCGYLPASTNFRISSLKFKLWRYMTLFCMLTNTTFNYLGLRMLIVGRAVFWTQFCWLVPVVTDTCSLVFIWSNVVWNRWKETHKSVPEPRNGKLYSLCHSQGQATNYENTVYFIYQGNTQISHTGLRWR